MNTKQYGNRYIVKAKSLFILFIFINSIIFSHAIQAKSSNTKFEIASGSALVIDNQTNKVLFEQNSKKIAPIASVTKLMTALVVIEDKQPLNERLSVTIDNVNQLQGVKSRVKLGSQLTREDLLLIMLMASENRAAATLANHYSKGYQAFIKAMNNKAKELGMENTVFVEPSGISEKNVSNAVDLTKLINALDNYPIIKSFSVKPEFSADFTNPAYTLPFRNTNHLIFSDKWNINLTKTGFTNAAGHCLVLLTEINNHPATLVVLDAFGKQTHFGDANRLKTWLETGVIKPVPEAAKSYRLNKQ